MLEIDTGARTRSRPHTDVEAPGERGEGAAQVAVPLAPSAGSVVGPVVVGADGSPGGERALRFAAKHADRLGADLVVVTAENNTRANDPKIAEHALIAQVAGCRAAHPRLTIRLRVVEVGAGEALLRAARAAQLVVVGAPRHHGAARPPLGETGWGLLRTCPCPVVVVPPVTPDAPGPSMPGNESDRSATPGASVLAARGRAR
jgi:nucleotide-binding universal stress UspA family protein